MTIEGSGDGTATARRTSAAAASAAAAATTTTPTHITHTTHSQRRRYYNEYQILYGFAFLVAVAGAVLRRRFHVATTTTDTDAYASCHGCYCVPDMGMAMGMLGSEEEEEDAQCPVEHIPRTDFDATFIATLRQITWLNPYTLDCDPYDNIAESVTMTDDDDEQQQQQQQRYVCQSEPPILARGGGACVVDYEYDIDEEMILVYQDDDNAVPSDTTDPSQQQQEEEEVPQTLGLMSVKNWSYRLRTYEGTFEQAMEEVAHVNEQQHQQHDGLYVTHAGPCGVCSSLQDLATYMEQGARLRMSATMCGFRGRFSERDGMACFQELGFTEACARVWYYNTKNTAKYCTEVCIPFVLSGAKPNDPLPTCPLTTCIECDEIYSGPIFQQFSGRTRRNSALRSSIVRPCSQMATLEQRDPRAFLWEAVQRRRRRRHNLQTGDIAPGAATTDAAAPLRDTNVNISIN